MDTIPRTPSDYRSWWEANASVPYGYCWCGCNALTNTASRNRPEAHWVKGCPCLFIKNHDKRLMSPANESAICEGYKNGKNSNALAAEWHLSQTAILGILKRGGVSMRSNSESHRRHTCDQHFFDDIDTENKAYWLGFIAADGYIRPDGLLHIGLQRKDHAHLEHFRANIQATYPVRFGQSSSGFPTSLITVCSRALGEGLARHGIVNRKARILCWPTTVNEPLLKHYLRGYFDGDGSVGIYKQRRVGRSTRQVPRWTITSTVSFCESARDYLIGKVDTGYVKICPRHETPGNGTLAYGGQRQVARIARLLYSDANVYLPRKRAIVEHLL